MGILHQLTRMKSLPFCLVVVFLASSSMSVPLMAPRQLPQFQGLNPQLLQQFLLNGDAAAFRRLPQFLQEFITNFASNQGATGRSDLTVNVTPEEEQALVDYIRTCYRNPYYGSSSSYYGPVSSGYYYNPYGYPSPNGGYFYG